MLRKRFWMLFLWLSVFIVLVTCFLFPLIQEGYVEFIDLRDQRKNVKCSKKHEHQIWYNRIVNKSYPPRLRHDFFCCVSLSSWLASSYAHFPRSANRITKAAYWEAEKQQSLLIITKLIWQFWIIYIILPKGGLWNVLNAILLAFFNNWFSLHLTFLCWQHL